MWGSLLAAAIPSAASMAGDWFSAKSAESGQMDANQMNYLIAKENRDWQEKMSNSAHQREVADLKAAGLNPVLSANAGANTPTPNMPVMENVKSGYNFRQTAEKASGMLTDMMNRKVLQSTAREAKANADVAENHAFISGVQREALNTPFARKIIGMDAIASNAKHLTSLAGGAYDKLLDLLRTGGILSAAGRVVS